MFMLLRILRCCVLVSQGLLWVLRRWLAVLLVLLVRGGGVRCVLVMLLRVLLVLLLLLLRQCQLIALTRLGPRHRGGRARLL